MARSPSTPERGFRRSLSSLLASLQEKDPTSEGHAERLAATVVALATHLRLDTERKRALVLAAHLHDVGKVAIPEEILLKRGALSAAEHDAVKAHCFSGSRLIAAAGLHEVSRWIRSHHERWDGRGYPDGLKGEQIPLESRILGLADALDAMTAPRVYRSPVSALEAAAEIERCAGAQFDPSLARWVASALRDGELAVSAPEAQPEAVAEPAAGGLAPLLSPS